MIDLNPEIITFGGTSSDECELFVSAIRRRSLAEGKYGDNEWIAYFASSCFVGEALYWYEGLDENVQSDWGNLRQAILERFGQRSQSQSISHRRQTVVTSPLPSIIPTPAAAAPPPLNSFSVVRTCRLKVVGHDGRPRGYIQNASTPDGRLGQLCKDPSKALPVSPSRSNMDILLQISISDQDSVQFSAKGKDWLAITWDGLTGSEWTEGPNFFANFCSWSTTTLSTKWATERRVWAISDSGEVAVHYPRRDLRTEHLLPYIDGDSCFLVWFKPRNPDLRRWSPVRVVLDEARE